MSKNVLVLCTGNSCRSQIADGYLKAFSPEGTNVYSAGVENHGVNPKAIETINDDGVDISGNTSNHIDEYANVDFDFIITVCDNAKEVCPVFNGKADSIIHQSFKDPANTNSSEQEILREFRVVRDLIKLWVDSL